MVKILLTPDEKEQLTELAGREPLATYCRRKLLGTPAENPGESTSHRSEPRRATTPPSSTKSVQAERVQKIKELVNEPESVPAIAKRRWA